MMVTAQFEHDCRTTVEKSEYIMMSGPGGKGHCQVAVNTKPPTMDENDKGPGSSGARGTLRGLFKNFAQAAQVRLA